MSEPLVPLTFWQRLSRTYLTGVLGVLPLALTLAVLAWLVVFLHNLVGPSSSFGKLLRSAGMTVSACEATAYVIGLVGVILMIYLVGVLVERGPGSTLRIIVDSAMDRVPVVNTVYDASKNLTSMFDRQGTIEGMAPVMCYFGDDLSTGIPALMPTPKIIRMNGADYRVVIVPTAPVPFGGALLCVKAEWVKPAACSMDELLGMYMSMGMSAPAHLNEDRTSAEDQPR